MTLIEINPNGRKYAKPVEECGRVAREGGSYEDMARAIIARLVALGFINELGIDAIHAEEDDNGEARSSIIGGGK